MRLWSLHPRYLDAQGLVALWREALLAQAVLRGLTRGYRHHPQLRRFQAAADPVAAVGVYLTAVAREAQARSYRFDASKIARPGGRQRLRVTRGQLAVERAHLLAKLARRDPDRAPILHRARPLLAHPLFTVVAGPRADWEKAEPILDRSQAARGQAQMTMSAGVAMKILRGS
jgi:hypothetical protein